MTVQVHLPEMVHKELLAEHPRNSNEGVYCIQNLKTGRYYIGSTNRLCKREAEHFNLLRKGAHHCVPLQRAFNKHGQDNLKYQILLRTSDYRAAEQSFLTYLYKRKTCYNTNNHSTGFAVGAANPAHTPTERARRRARLLRNNPMHDPCVSAKVAGRNNPMYGVGGPAHPRWGQTHTESARRRIALGGIKRLGSNNGKSRSVRQLTLTGEVVQTWDCIADAVKQLGKAAHDSSISAAARGRQRSAHGFRWEYTDAN